MAYNPQNYGVYDDEILDPVYSRRFKETKEAYEEGYNAMRNFIRKNWCHYNSSPYNGDTFQYQAWNDGYNDYLKEYWSYG